MSQGKNANINGLNLEKRVEAALNSYNIAFIKQHKYKSIYGHDAKMDFYVPAFDTAIECKNQEGAGSVSEKIPYVLESFLQHPASAGLLILGGSYWPTKPGIMQWAEQKSRLSHKQIKIIYFEHFGDWIEQTSIRCAA